MSFAHHRKHLEVQYIGVWPLVFRVRVRCAGDGYVKGKGKGMT